MTTGEMASFEAGSDSSAEPSAWDTPDRYIVLEDATWADYQRMIELRGEGAVPRLTFLEGRLQIMAPSLSHESVKSLIGCLVEAWCVENGVDLTPCGSWTLQKKAVERGLEPDECYVFGDFPTPDPERPDLAIEVVWTSGGLSKLEVYRKLGVREVWTCRKQKLSIHELVGEEYVVRERSVHLPDLDPDLLLRFVEVRPMTRAVREYLAALREG